MTPATILPPVVAIEAVALLLDRGAPVKMIDVRNLAGFAAAHVPGSYNVPLAQLPEYRAALRDTLRAPVIRVCRSGQRARQAERVLREADLTRIHVLDGGIAAWERADTPWQRGRQRRGRERQVRGVAGALVLAGALGGALAWRPFTYLAAASGGGLAFSAATDSCGMTPALSKLPYNRVASCDVREVVARLGNVAA